MHWPQALRQLSLVNVRINAAPAFEACQVDIDSVASYMGRGQSKLTSLFGLLFRRSSCQHPLLAAALGELPLGSTLSACCLACMTPVGDLGLEGEDRCDEAVHMPCRRVAQRLHAGKA